MHTKDGELLLIYLMPKDQLDQALTLFLVLEKAIWLR